MRAARRESTREFTRKRTTERRIRIMALALVIATRHSAAASRHYCERLFVRRCSGGARFFFGLGDECSKARIAAQVLQVMVIRH